jgi:hypothetical protein
MLESRRQRGLVDTTGATRGSNADLVDLEATLELAVEGREPLLMDLALVGASDLELRSRSELVGRDLLARQRRPLEMEPRSIRSSRPSRSTPRMTTWACGLSVS